jgi:hypothetical protein
MSVTHHRQKPIECTFIRSLHKAYEMKVLGAGGLPVRPLYFIFESTE